MSQNTQTDLNSLISIVEQLVSSVVALESWKEKVIAAECAQEPHTHVFSKALEMMRKDIIMAEKELEASRVRLSAAEAVQRELFTRHKVT